MKKRIKDFAKSLLLAKALPQRAFAPFYDAAFGDAMAAAV